MILTHSTTTSLILALVFATCTFSSQQRPGASRFLLAAQRHNDTTCVGQAAFRVFECYRCLGSVINDPHFHALDDCTKQYANTIVETLRETSRLCLAHREQLGQELCSCLFQ